MSEQQKIRRLADMNPYLQRALMEMCKRVGADAESIDYGADDWYVQHEWSQQEQELFKDWLAAWLYDDAKARRALMEFPRKNKKYCRQVADWFVFQYGWRTSQQADDCEDELE